MKPYIRSRRFWVGMAIGATAMLGVIALAAAALVAAVPPELRYRSAVTAPDPVRDYSPLPFASVDLAPYQRGHKDGVAFPSLSKPRDRIAYLPGTPNSELFMTLPAPEFEVQRVPEPGALALIAVAAVAARIFGRWA